MGRMTEEELRLAEARWRSLSYICFCSSRASIKDRRSLCSACREQVRLGELIERHSVLKRGTYNYLD